MDWTQDRRGDWHTTSESGRRYQWHYLSGLSVLDGAYWRMVPCGRVCTPRDAEPFIEQHEARLAEVTA